MELGAHVPGAEHVLPTDIKIGEISYLYHHTQLLRLPVLLREHRALLYFR